MATGVLSMRDLDEVPEEQREQYIREMTAPITDDDLMDSIVLLKRMKNRCPPDSFKHRYVELVIEQTEALLHGQPSILSRDTIERAIKKHYWD
jgi:hypothetical protein